MVQSTGCAAIKGALKIIGQFQQSFLIRIRIRIIPFCGPFYSQINMIKVLINLILPQIKVHDLKLVLRKVTTNVHHQSSHKHNQGTSDVNQKMAA